MRDLCTKAILVRPGPAQPNPTRPHSTQPRPDLTQINPDQPHPGHAQTHPGSTQPNPPRPNHTPGQRRPGLTTPRPAQPNHTPDQPRPGSIQPDSAQPSSTHARLDHTTPNGLKLSHSQNKKSSSVVFYAKFSARMVGCGWCASWMRGLTSRLSHRQSER